jgi:hypothetical protein
LGSALRVTLKHLLKRRPALVAKPLASGVENAQPTAPTKAIALRSTLPSADIVLPATDGREIRLSRITEPTAEQQNSCSGNSASVFPNTFNSTANVV